jgi:hypothetical protein
MAKETRIELEQDEAVVVHVASRILSAHVASNQCESEAEDAMLAKSVDLAIRLTRSVDIAVSAGSEVKSGLQNDPNYRPLG